MNAVVFPFQLCAEEFNLPKDTDANDIYAAMDWLVGRQPSIERKLASRHLDSGSMAFYDLSCSSYCGTHCELAKRGYNRDGLKGVDILVRPIRRRDTDRVKAHILLTPAGTSD